MEIKPSTTDTLNDIPVISGCLLSVEYVDDANSFDIIQVSIIIIAYLCYNYSGTSDNGHSK